MWSKEEYLLGQAKHRSNAYPFIQSDLLGNSTAKGVRYEHTGRMGVRKYLKKSYYHRIECPAANFLATFIWRRPLNSATLATTTHRKPERMSDGTSTQLVTQMIKRRVKINKMELYNNVRDPPWRKGEKKVF